MTNSKDYFWQHNTAMQIHRFEKDALPSRIVAIKPIGGLGSRMKCIASFAVIAEHFGVPLYVYWTVSAGFEKIEYNELFDTTPDNVKLFDAHSWNLLRGLGSTERVIKLDERISYLTRNYMYSSYKLDELFLTRKPFRLTAECNRDLQKLYKPTLQRFIARFQTFYHQNLNAFEPVSMVKKLVAHEVRAWGEAGTNVLGIHLRRNDALQSRVSTKYLSPSDKDVFAMVDAHIGASSPTSNRVFLATDDPDTFDAFAEKYKDNVQVRWFPWKRFNYKLQSEKGGQLKALVDLTTLRCCNKVVGTTFSVFNEVARLLIHRSMVLQNDCLLNPENNAECTTQKLVADIDTEEPPNLPTPKPETKTIIEKTAITDADADAPAPTSDQKNDDEHTTDTATKADSINIETVESKENITPTKTIATKTLLYLYKANPDSLALQKQIRLLLNIDCSAYTPDSVIEISRNVSKECETNEHEEQEEKNE